MKVKDLDFEKIITKYNEACALIPTEYHNFTLYSWKYEMSSKNELTADFTIEGTKKGEGTTTEGRNIVTTYYEFKFEMDKNGELNIKN